MSRQHTAGRQLTAAGSTRGPGRPRGARRFPARPAAHLVRWVLCWLLTLAGPGALAGQVERPAPADPAWRFGGDVAADTRYGEDVLVMGTGSAVLPDVAFRDGTIAFDMRPTDRRAFLGVLFRIPAAPPDGPRHYENIYLRLHKSRLPDAIQYTPDYRGIGQWQLYHGPSATARATYTAGEWQRVRIEVRGEQAAVFVGDAAEPQLLVDRLRSGSDAGFVGFWANFPGATEDDPPSALLRDITIRHGETSWSFGAPEPETAPAGAIRAWGVSRPFERDGADVLELPEPALRGAWRTLESDPSGLLPLQRHLERPDDGVAAVLAGLRIRADRARRVRLDLGYSDDASVFLNGQLLYSGRFGFSHNFPRRQGLITLDQAAVHLPLRRGENRVIIAVSDDFGGWGLMGRIADRQGLEIGPLLPD